MNNIDFTKNRWFSRGTNHERIKSLLDRGTGNNLLFVFGLSDGVTRQIPVASGSNFANKLLGVETAKMREDNYKTCDKLFPPRATQGVYHMRYNDVEGFTDCIRCGRNINVSKIFKRPPKGTSSDYQELCSYCLSEVNNSGYIKLNGRILEIPKVSKVSNAFLSKPVDDYKYYTNLDSLTASLHERYLEWVRDNKLLSVINIVRRTV